MQLGKHLILDLWGDPKSFPYWNMDAGAEALKRACLAAGTTIMTERWHHFGDGHGYTGVIILAESHLSVHTWPEVGYAAVDAFYCGTCDPKDSIPEIVSFYKPKRYDPIFISRGKHDGDGTFYE